MIMSEFYFYSVHSLGGSQGCGLLLSRLVKLSMVTREAIDTPLCECLECYGA